MPDDPMSEGGGTAALEEGKTSPEASPKPASPTIAAGAEGSQAAKPAPAVVRPAPAVIAKPAPAVATAPRPAAAAGAPKPALATAVKPAPAVAGGAKPAAAAGPRPSAPTPEQIAAERAKIVSVLEEKRRLGEQVTITVEHKEIALTGRVLRIEPEEGFVVLENVDGRRRGLWFILGGSLKTRDGQEIKLPVDGVPR